MTGDGAFFFHFFYLRLEFNGEDVLPSAGVLRLQPQRLELRVDEEQPENGVQ